MQVFTQLKIMALQILLSSSTVVEYAKKNITLSGITTRQNKNKLKL